MKINVVSCAKESPSALSRDGFDNGRNPLTHRHRAAALSPKEARVRESILPSPPRERPGGGAI